MIKIEDGITTAKGNAQQLTKEWYELTFAVIKGLEAELGTKVDILLLIEGAETLIKEESEK